MKAFRVTVPASSGNVGPGFDSMGLALNLHLRLEVRQQDQWEFKSPSTPENQPFEEHFIYKVILQIAERYGKVPPPCSVIETSSIPLARGLGSSASAIVAGIEIANQLCDLQLSPEEKLAYATDIEGHPDNVAPALFGGLVISTLIQEEIDWIKCEPKNLYFIASIPDVELTTEASRDVLPKTYTNEEAALASGISNLSTAALLTGNYQLAGRMLEKDRFHEPYRKTLIPNYDLIKEEAREAGAYGTILSGAGPTMLSFVSPEKSEQTKKHLEHLLPDYRIEIFEVDVTGSQVEKL